MQVIDIKTAKELGKYLPKGFESEKEWVWFKGTGWEICDTGKHTRGHHCQPDKYPAPTLCEVWELLPNQVASDNMIRNMTLIEECFLKDDIVYSKRITPYFVEYFSHKHQKLKDFGYGNSTNLATACAQLFMYLTDQINIHTTQGGE